MGIILTACVIGVLLILCQCYMIYLIKTAPERYDEFIFPDDEEMISQRIVYCKSYALVESPTDERL